MDEYYEVDGGRYCELHVAAALAAASHGVKVGVEAGGVGKTGLGYGSAGSGGHLGFGLGLETRRAEKRQTRLVELPVGGIGF